MPFQDFVFDLHSSASIEDRGAHSANSSFKKFVFVDSRVEDFDSLAEDVSSHTKVLVVDQESDGIKQISDWLSGQAELLSVSIIAHSFEGNMFLGSGFLNSDSILDNADRVKEWGNALSQNEDILLYGCNVASGAIGDQFLATLGALTGADIAGSIDITGNAELGGNWVLEKTFGEVEPQPDFSAEIMGNYRGILPVVINAAGATGEETLQLQIDGQAVQSWTNVGGNYAARQFQSFTYNVNGIAPDRIRVAFTNNGVSQTGADKNLNIDSIAIDGNLIQTEYRICDWSISAQRWSHTWLSSNRVAVC
ncbi:MAG: DUF4347 domain-containing protein [Pirellula sp.]